MWKKDKLNMGRKKKNPVFEQIEIVGTASKGKGIGHAPDGRVIFVPYTAPGDIVDIQTVKKRKKYYEGKVLKFHKYSDWRTEPKCKYFGICGGCQWQHVRYEKQLEIKAVQVRENLKRIGGIDYLHEQPVLASPKTYAYRNKMEYAFTDARWLTREEIETDAEFDRRGLGFHVPGHWDKIIDIEHCPLQPDPGNEIRNELKAFAIRNNLKFYNPRAREGLLRQLTIRIMKSGEIMVLVHFFENRPGEIKQVMDFLQNTFPQINSLQYVINPKANDTIYDLPVHLWKGKDYITEQIGHLNFRIKAQSFFQTNSFQTENLYNKILEYAGLKGNEIIYDLYSGTGTIALFLASKAKFVLGIEAVEQAVEDARVNAQTNQIDNVDFIAGDMKEVFTPSLMNQYGQPDIIVADPPREGMHTKTVENLIKIKPQRIIYVSCNSATQARDLAILKNFYEIRLSQPVDMFPQTHHVENILVLERKQS